MSECKGHKHDTCCCGCGHDHHDHDGHGHEHHHGHECGCGHGHKHDGHARHHSHGHKHHGHGHHNHACGCDHDHEHHGHEHHECGCGCGHGHHHEAFVPSQLSAEPTFSFSIVGLDCPNCARTLQDTVCSLEEVADARVIFATATLEVVAAPDVDLPACKRSVLDTVRSCGEDLELSDAERIELHDHRGWFAQNRQKILMCVSAFALVAGLVSEHVLGSEPRAIPFYVIAAVAGLVYISPMAFAAIRRRSADMNVLMGIAVLGALIIGFTGDPSVFGDAAIVIFLDQVGEWLEGWSMRKTSSSIEGLMNLVPSVAHVVAPEGGTVDVQTSGVGVGYTIRVLPGERVPLDGTITQGSSSFNEAPVTGESVPQDKGEGDEVFAGSLNTSGVVDVKVMADESGTTLARIVSEVQGAQAAKAPYESFVNRFAAAYTPVVIAGAAILGLVVPLILSIAQGSTSIELWREWCYRACSLLVVACPCALVISTPVSFVSALSRAARMGVLVKGGAYFDLATRVRAIAFDKTGTLTTGTPCVNEVVAFGLASTADVLSVAVALEEHSTHPLARAVAAEAMRKGVLRAEAQDVKELTASGMLGVVSGETCTIGKLAHAQQHVTPTEEVLQTVARMGQAGSTALVVTRGNVALGVIAVADAVRNEAPAVIKTLATKEGIALEMLTGDNELVAASVANTLGIERVLAGVLPEDKLGRIGEIQKTEGPTAMVGDGINDAPALAQADVGITMGAAASDTALEVADVALLSNSLELLPAFFALAHRTMNIVRENIVFALGVKIVVFVLVSVGLAGMGAAVFADTGVALIVVLNGMRLMRASRIRW